MSYVLINGKRYYKDDRSGQITLDNVSQETAEYRAQRSRPVVTQPPQLQRSSSVATRTQAHQHPGPLSQLVSLLSRMVRAATIVVAAGSILLIGSYCIKEPLQFQASFHYELRDIGELTVRLTQAGDRLTELFEAERGNGND